MVYHDVRVCKQRSLSVSDNFCGQATIMSIPGVEDILFPVFLDSESVDVIVPE